MASEVAVCIMPHMSSPAEPHGPATTAGPSPPIFWLALLATLVLDLASKYVVFALVDARHSTWLELHTNPGVAWSMLDDKPRLVAGLTAVLIPVLWWAYRRWYGSGHRLEHLAFGLILGGALGNAWDRAMAMRPGLTGIDGVRDFIRVDLNLIGIDYIWPIFNLADTGITIGFLLLLTLSWWPRPRGDQQRPASGTAA